uniref:Uncharacterized protein n=1 Tax=Anguilla anguilla TaxID=7936 RepID=A0A0E9QZ69_ANGAN
MCSLTLLVQSLARQVLHSSSCPIICLKAKHGGKTADTRLKVSALYPQTQLTCLPNLL